MSKLSIFITIEYYNMRGGNVTSLTVEFVFEFCDYEFCVSTKVSSGTSAGLLNHGVTNNTCSQSTSGNYSIVPFLNHSEVRI